MPEPKLIAEGHWGRVYDLGDGTVAKCFRADANPKAIQLEAEVANLASSLGVPTPTALDIKNEPGHGVLRFAKINGETVARHVMERPWRLFWATHQMARIFSQIHTVEISGTRPIKRALANRIGRAPELSDAERSTILDRLEQLEDGNMLCHYDYHPGNVMVSQRKCFVIDWGGATHGPAIADVTHAYVLNKVDGVLQDVPWLNRIIVRSLRGLYIELFLFHYARGKPDCSYRSLKADIKRWILPVAAARLASYGDFETEALLRMIRRNLRQTR